MWYLAPPGDSIIRIIGIDPGTDTLGLSVLDVDMDNDYEARLVYARTHTASKSVKDLEWQRQMRGGRDVRLQSHSELLASFLEEARPNLVAAESPFLKFGRVQAYEALVECYAMLRETLWNYSHCMVLRRIDPITAKNSVQVSHIGTDKDDIKAKILEMYSGRTDVDINDLDEHSTDAAAVAHCAYRQIVLGETWSSTRKKKKGRNPRRRKRKK